MCFGRYNIAIQFRCRYIMSDKYKQSGLLDELTLGKPTDYQSQYDPALLQGVPRSLNRDDLNLPKALPFRGEDLWTGYEISWLNAKGKPVVAIGEFRIPATSKNLIESKSFKLYLNSFNQSKFDNWQGVRSAMEKDLSHCAGEDVSVQLFKVDEIEHFRVTPLPGVNLDKQDISIEQYEFDSSLVHNAKDGSQVSETLNSHLLKSNCLITSQPDWASVVIKYTGPKIDHESLLRYLISFRMHNEFHEQCVERIFTDIQRNCSPTELTVYARYTRRGGLDINPYRSSAKASIDMKLRDTRQ